jgi:hypothetical protein
MTCPIVDDPITLVDDDFTTVDGAISVCGMWAMYNKIDEIWARLGLDPARPLLTTTTSIDAGAGISMSLSGDENSSTLTRLP